MAIAPSTKGMGQGAAQVFDTSGLARTYGQGVMLEEQQKAAQRKDEEKRLAELLGAGGDLFKEKYYATRDDGVLRQRYKTDILDWMKGKEKKIIDPSSPEAQEYRQRMQNLMFDFKMSEESKNLAQTYVQDVVKNPYEYEPESLQYIQEFQKTPLAVFDPSKIRKVNNFDIEKEFNALLPQYRQTIQDQGTTSFYSKNADVFGNYDRTRSTDALEQNQMNTFIKELSNNPQAVEKVNEMYGEEVAQLRDQGQDVTVWDLVNRDYKPRLKVDVTKSTFSQAAGDGKKKEFNPNNIVENIDLKTGGEKSILEGFKGTPLENAFTFRKLKKTPTKMYQTTSVQATVPVTANAIDMTTGEKLQDIGTYQVDMSSPVIYDGKLMVPALVKGIKGEKGEIHVSALIPAEEVQEQFLEEGYDLNDIATKMGVPFGKTTTTSSSGITWK